MLDSFDSWLTRNADDLDCAAASHPRNPNGYVQVSKILPLNRVYANFRMTHSQITLGHLL